MPSASPQAEIPVQPEDVRRYKWRIAAYCLAAASLAIAMGAWIYQRNVDPIHAMESYDDAVRLFRIARYNQAIIALDRTFALKPEFADAYFLRGRAYAAESKIEQAILDYSRFLALRPNDIAARLDRALAYLDQKDYRHAMEDCTEALRVDPQRSQAYNLRGSALRALGDSRSALQDFTRAVDLDANVDNYYQRAETYQSIGEHRLAIEDLNQVIKFQPDQAPAFFARAKSRTAIGDLEGAKADFAQGRVIDAR